jgi:hypothetical protein
MDGATDGIALLWIYQLAIHGVNYSRSSHAHREQLMVFVSFRAPRRRRS